MAEFSNVRPLNCHTGTCKARGFWENGGKSQIFEQSEAKIRVSKSTCHPDIRSVNKLSSVCTSGKELV